MFSSASPLARRPAKATPCLPLLPESEDHGIGPGLALGRVHEICGGARHRMALWLAAQSQGAVLWITPDWTSEQLNPCGMAGFVDPARLLLAQPDRADDVLWCAEEALRLGTVALVVADLTGLPGLTSVRRMHLAAEAGGRTGGTAPLGLLLTPGMGGAQGAESRWHLTSDYKGKSGAWRLTRLRARMAPEHSWEVTRHSGQRLPQVTQRIKAA